MDRRKLLFGLAAGTIGYGAYLLARGKMKPIAVKALSGAFTLGEGARNFIGDVTDEARKIKEKKVMEIVQKNQEIELEAIKGGNDKNMMEHIEELKNQIHSMEEKIRSLKAE